MRSNWLYSWDALWIVALLMAAMLLAFTFGMAADRFAERQRLVTDEANMLHRVLLHSSLLPEPARAQFQKSLRQLVDARLAFFDARQNLVAVGFAGGIANHRGTIGKWLLAVLLGATIFIVLDLDRPRGGVFQISQEPIVHFKELLNRSADIPR